MNRRVFITLILAVPLCVYSTFLSAQMPDWKFFRDREGNSYYYDRALKIRITDENLFEYTPASIKGVDYYLHKGIEFVKYGKYAEGLFYLKSLKTLPADDLRVQRRAEEASRWINYLQKKHGTRYEIFDKESTILLNFSENQYNLINEKLRYKFTLKNHPKIVKALWKLYDQGYGLKFGFNLDKNNSEPGYDCIIGVESRILKGKIENLAEAENSWRNEFGKDNFKRVEILRRADRVIYSYTYSDGVPFSGIEGIYINGKIIHIVRVLCSNSIKDKVFEEIRKPVEEMVLVR